MRLQPDEDPEYAWSLRETPAARLEFIETLPDEHLNTFVVGGFWPKEADGLDIMKAVIAHPGLSMISAMAIYCCSNALSLGQEEARSNRPEWLEGMDEEIEVLQSLRDKLNAMAFADRIYPYQHFSSMVKWVVRENGPETFGSYALDPQVVSYVENAMQEVEKASDATRYDSGEEPMKSDESLQSLLTAMEDSDDRDKLTRIGRAAIWLRKQLGFV